MSSESDEDELLQMALQEQSMGKKPSEPPPKQNPSRGAAATPNRKVQPKHRKDPSEVDEYDSDLEILSISSGEEDKPSSKRDTKAPPKKRAPRGPGKDDDEHWHGGEPDCWKRVDEDEVSKLAFFEAPSICLAMKFHKYFEVPQNCLPFTKNLTFLIVFLSGHLAMLHCEI